MAKGQVTDEELEASLQSVGGLGGIAGSGARRDSPFGTDFVRKGTPAPKARIESAAAQEITKTVEIKGRGVRSESEPKEAPQPIKKVGPVSVPSPSVEEVPVDSEAKESTRKADTLTERVTLQMSPEMRDRVNELSRKLQRAKTDKKSERITANTVMRVAIQVFLDSDRLGELEGVNSEEELLAKLLVTRPEK